MADAKKPTFSEAQRIADAPARLKIGEMNEEMRVRLFNSVYQSIRETAYTHPYEGYSSIREPWVTILRDFYDREGASLEDFSTDLEPHIRTLRSLIHDLKYNQVFDFLQGVLRHPMCPVKVRAGVAQALERSHAAYLLIDGDTFVPAPTAQDADTFSNAVASANKFGIAGCNTHLRNAGNCANSGDVAGCLRESVQAAEGAAAVVSGESTFGAALITLLKRDLIDERVKKSIEAIYNMSNQEPGARHSLKRQGQIELEMEEALYALSTCAAFVSYVITRGYLSGVLSPAKSK